MRIRMNQHILFYIIVTLFWFAQYVYIPFQSTYLISIGTISSMVGVIIGAYGITQMLLRLPVGIYADCIGKHKALIIVGALLSGLASVVRVYCCDGTGFLIANLLSGVASATWISFMVYYTGQYSNNQQQLATSKVIMFNNLGMLLGFITSTLCYSIMGMKYLCLSSVFAGIFACILALFLKEPKKTKEHLSIKALCCVCMNKRLIIFSFVALIQQGIQLTTTMSFTNQIMRDCGASNTIVGLSSIIYMISVVGFAGLASTKWIEQKGPKVWIPLVLSIIAVYCVSVAFTHYIPCLLFLQILPGMSTGLLLTYATSEAMKDIPPEKKSTAMGFFQAVYAIGMTTFPIFTGSVVSSHGMAAGYILLAIIAFFSSILMGIYYKKNQMRLKQMNLQMD